MNNLFMKVIFGAYLFLVPAVKLQVFPRITFGDLLYVFMLPFLILNGYHKAKISAHWIFISMFLWMSLSLSGLGVFFTYNFVFEWIGISYLITIPLSIILIWKAYSVDVSYIIRVISLSYLMSLIYGTFGILWSLIYGDFPVLFYDGGVKLVGPFLFPNQYAYFLIAWFPIFYVSALSTKPSFVKTVVVLLVALNVFATGSRTGAGVFIAEAALLLVILSLFERNLKSIYVALIAVVGVMFVPQLFSTKFWAFERAFLFIHHLKGGEFTDPFRSLNWAAAIHEFMKYPFVGVGLGNFWRFYGKEVHNTFLSILAETGLLGFLGFFMYFLFIFIYMMSNVFQRTGSSQSSDKYYKNIILSLLVSLFSSFLFGVQHYILRARHFWIIIGLSFLMIETIRSAHVRD